MGHPRHRQNQGGVPVLMTDRPVLDKYMGREHARNFLDRQAV